MKRVLSWIVLYCLAAIFMLCSAYYSLCVSGILSLISKDYFFLTVLVFMIFAFIGIKLNQLAVNITKKLSQKICVSENRVRYIICAIIIIIFSFINAVFAFSDEDLVFIVLFSVMLWVCYAIKLFKSEHPRYIRELYKHIQEQEETIESVDDNIETEIYTEIIEEDSSNLVEKSSEKAVDVITSSTNEEEIVEKETEISSTFSSGNIDELIKALKNIPSDK